MPDKPVVADNKPKKTELKKGGGLLLVRLWALRQSTLLRW